MNPVHEWLFEFRNAANVVVARYTAEGGAATIDGTGSVSTTAAYVDEVLYRVTAEGDCIDASWLGGDSDGVLPLVEPRSFVVIYRKGTRSGEDEGTFYPRWAGVVTLCPSLLRADGLPGRYRAVGWSTVFYETDTGTNTERAAGSDLATYWNNLAAYTPLGTTQPTLSPVGLTVAGAVNADSVSLGQFYEALSRLGQLGGLDLRAVVTADRESLLVERNTTKATLAATDPVDIERWEVQGPDDVQNVRWILADSTLTNDVQDGDILERQTPNVKTHVSSSPDGGIIISGGGKLGYRRGTKALTPPEGQEVFVPLLDPALWQTTDLVPIVVTSTTSVSATSYSTGDNSDDPIVLAGTVALGAGVTSISVSALTESVPANAILAFPTVSAANGWLLFRVTTTAGIGATTIVGEQLSGQANSGASGVRADRMFASGRASRVEFSQTFGGGGGQFTVTVGVYKDGALGVVDAVAYDVAIEESVGSARSEHDGAILTVFGRGGEFLLGRSSSAIPAFVNANGISFIPMPATRAAEDELQRFTGISYSGDRDTGTPSSGETFYGVRMNARSAGVDTMAAVIGYAMPLAVDTAALDALAEAEYSVPTLSAFRARVYSRDPELVGLLDVNLTGGGSVTDVPVSVVEYALRGAEGASAVYVCGERERPEVTAFTRAVRDRDARAATSAAKAGARRQA